MTAPVIFNAFDFSINSRLHRLQRKNTQLAPLPFPKVWFATWNNEKMFFVWINYLDRNPSSCYELFGWFFPLTILAIKRSIVSRWLPKYLKHWRLFCGFCHLISTLTVLITLPPGFKEKPHVNLQSTILLRNMSWINHETRNTQDDDIKLWFKAPKRNRYLNLKTFLSILSKND